MNARPWGLALALACLIACQTGTDPVEDETQAATTCVQDQDCFDSNVCTFDRCSLLTHTCHNIPIPNCCTSNAMCDDGVACTADACDLTNDSCTHTTIPNCCTSDVQCADGDPCTTDTCNPATHMCVHQGTGTCCSTDADCHDGDACTFDRCNLQTHSCVHVPVPDCCDTDSDCADSDVCTQDVCIPVLHRCAHSPISNCCHGTNTAECNDGELCTTDSCNTSTHRCVHNEVPGCCQTDSDCMDNNACTVDDCNTSNHTCTNTTMPGCCQFDGDCDDGDGCTFDRCSLATHTCQHQAIPNCCQNAADCNDNNPCTTDTCNTSNGTCSNTPKPNCPGDAGVGDSGVGDSGVGGDAGRDAGVNGFDVSGGGCACHTGGGDSPLPALWIALAIAWPLVRRRRALALVAVVAGAAGTARAGGFDAELFRPATSSSAYFSQLSGRVLPAGELDLGVGFDFANDPLVARDLSTGDVLMNGGIVSNRLSLQVAAGYGIRDRFEVGVAVPLVLAQDGDLSLVAMGRSLSTTTLGDVRLFGKVQAWKRGDMMLACALDVSLPTGSSESFTGAPTASAWPRVVLGWQPGRWSSALNVGFALRGESQLANVSVGNELTTGIAVGYELKPARLWLLGEGFLAHDTSGGDHDTPAEVLAGVRATIRGPWRGQVAIGEGVGRGVSAPAFEAIAAMSYSADLAPKPEVKPIRIEPPPPPPVDVDTDGDGILDKNDQCPKEPEDKDGFQDEDGCPDPDNDGDGVPDATDKCPLVAEDRDGFQDEDGCPDPDNDGDGIPDAQDACVNEPETKNGYLDEDGCPDEIPTKVKQFTGVVHGVNFKLGSADLLPGSQKVLDEAVKVLQEFPDLVFEIQGHTDDQPLGKRAPFKDNEELSLARAESVRAYMTAMGIAPARLVAKGYGSSKPLTDPNGLSGAKLRTARAQNRRVQFEIVVKTP